VSDAPAISVENLKKRFGDVAAVDGISFVVPLRGIFGFLGPNGAGKTTTINMLTGLARPDAGVIRVAGINCTGNPKAAQHLMGVVPDERNLYPELTGFENLCFCGALYGMRKEARDVRARELLERFDLSDAAGRKFEGYSKGMKRKLAIAAGIIHDPPILFLDEPTTGIDVAGARRIRQLIVDLQQAGKTIFLTTHYIEEAEHLCGRVAFIVAGRIVRYDAVENLLRHAQGRHIVEFAVNGVPDDIVSELPAAFPGTDCEHTSEGVFRFSSDAPVRIGPLVHFFENRGLEVGEARKVHPSLEEVFVRATSLDADALKKEKDKAGGGA
jgi:ABC-2 type transport system ATP-binding protein